MKKQIVIIIAMVFGFSVLSNAQTEMVIEVTTDNNPEETHWVLYDVLNNTIHERTQFEKEVTHLDTITLDDTKCYYWTIYDSYGDGLNGGINPGSYNIFLNGELIAECTNPDFGDSISVYNIGTACSPNDVGVLNMAMLYYLSKDNEYIKANIVNMGAEPITSIELFYTVDDFTSATVEIADLSIQLGRIYEVVYPTPHDFNTAGEYTIELTITKANGDAVAGNINNSATTNVEVLDGYVQYNVIEDFMSYACGPCYDAGIMLDGTLENFNGTQSLIKYMMWSFADTKYFEELEELGNYYNVGGIPHIRLNGEIVNYLYFTPTFYADYVGIATPIKLTVNSKMVGDSLITNIKMLSNTDLEGDFVIRAMPVEKTAYDVSISYDNTAPYHNVVYDIINGIDGIQVGENIAADTELEYSVSNSIIDYPFEEGSFEDMSIVVYLQETTSDHIFQSQQVDMPYNIVEPKLTYNIENNATEVDTAGLQITISSNRHLYNVDGNNITNIKDYLKLKKGSETGATVPFIATINENKNFITITPQYGWELESTYYLLVDEFSTIDEIIIPNNVLSFTTIKGLGIAGMADEYLQVYPNPAKNLLTINSSSVYKVELISATGQIVSAFDLVKGQNSINISDYNTGVYFIKVKTDIDVQIIKIIKQ